VCQANKLGDIPYIEDFATDAQVLKDLVAQTGGKPLTDIASTPVTGKLYFASYKDLETYEYPKYNNG